MKSNAVTFLYKFSHRKWHHSERDSKLVGVSIHVPTRGTTESIELDVYFKAFQSTFPQGERQKRTKTKAEKPSFNPRSRKGNDGRIGGLNHGKNSFNPRSRKGNDDYHK